MFNYTTGGTMKVKDMNEIDINTELFKLRKEVESRNKRMMTLINEKKRRKEIEAKKFIDTLPSDMTKLSSSVWKRLLHVPDYNGQGQTIYKFSHDALREYGLDSFGYNPETNQLSITVWKRDFDPKKFKRWFNRVKHVLVGMELKRDYRTPGWKNVFNLHVSIEDCDTIASAYIKLDPPYETLFYRSRRGKGDAFTDIDSFISHLTTDVFHINK